MRVGSHDGARQQSFPDLNPNPVFESSLDGKIVFSNPAARAVFGEFEALPWLREIACEYAKGKRENATLTVRAGPSRWYQLEVIFLETEKAVRFYCLDVTERKRAEEKALQEKDRLAALVQSIPDEVWFADTEKRIVLANRPALHNYDLQTAEGVPLESLNAGLEVFWPDGKPRPIEEAAALRALHGEVVKSQEVLVRMPATGDMRCQQINAAPVRDSAGMIIGSVAVIRDVTEQKEAEKERARLFSEAERRAAELNATISSMATGLIIYNMEGKAVWMNSIAEQTFTSELFFNKTVGERQRIMAWEKENGQPFLTEEIPAQRALRGDTVHNVVLAAPFPDRTVWISASAAPIRTPDGTMLGAVASFVDVTERKALERHLAEMNERLEAQVRERTGQLEKSVRLYRMLSQCNQALVAAADETELIRSLCHFIVAEGGYLMAWVGYAEDNDARTVRPVANVGFEDGYLERARITWADVERGRGPTGTAIRENRVCVGADFFNDDSLRPWRDEALTRGFRSSLALPLASPNGAPFGALTIYSGKIAAFDKEEIALFKELAGDMAYGLQALRARAQRDETQRTLEERNAQLHGLTAQLTLAEQKERRQLAGVLHDELQQILVGLKLRLECVDDATAKPCQDLLESCLQITRSLTAKLCPSVLYKGNMVAVLEWLTQWAKEKYGLDITLETDIRQMKLSEDITIMIYRSVQELIFNIAKHAQTREGKIEVVSAGNQIQIKVSDAGRGFDPATVRGQSVEGGFGLFAVQERLQNRGCGFAVQSAPGRGSVFTILVATAEAAEAAPAIQSAARSKIRVLVVDDHSVVRQALAAMLNLSDDIEVVGEAENGRVALDRARRLLPDVVLMDIEMPEIDGIKATRLLRLEHPHMKVIGLSMHDRKDVEADFLNAGAVAFIMKNSPSAELLQAIRAVHAL